MVAMTAAKQRKLQRVVHLVAGAALLGYVYAPLGGELEAAVRMVVFPLLVVTGIAMWQAPRLRRGLRRLAS
jgi:hypothetical protein